MVVPQKTLKDYQPSTEAIDHGGARSEWPGDNLKGKIDLEQMRVVDEGGPRCAFPRELKKAVATVSMAEQAGVPASDDVHDTDNVVAVAKAAPGTISVGKVWKFDPEREEKKQRLISLIAAADIVMRGAYSAWPRDSGRKVAAVKQ